jgi:peptidoglycan hydrolase CwlO-like protein
MRKTLAFLFLIFVALCHASVFAVEIAPRISDREIIENLSDLRGDIKELKAGQKALEQRFDDMNNSVNRRFDDVNRRFDDLQESTNKRFDTLQWMLGLFITVALSIFGIMGRILWNQQKKLTQIEATLEAQKEEISFLKSLIEKLQSLIEKLLPPRGVL